MLALYTWLMTWLRRDEGQDLVEYALLLALIALAAIIAIGAAGGAIDAIWQDVVAALGGVVPPAP